MPTITTREGLIAALHEAAEIEHGLLLQYLYAALSLKQRPEESVTPEQFTALRKWKGILLAVAVDEMGHLGTVFNLLGAIGAPPHLDRPSFPRNTNYYPFAFELVPFSDAALRRFVTAELPRGFTIDDCLGAQNLAFAARDIVPDVPLYKYVGELYDQIAEGFRAIPEATLFIGSPKRQVDNEWSVNVDIRMVVDRASALEAIADIVEDGEGAGEHRETSHYGRYCSMWKEFRKAPFEAARPVVTNPRTRPPRELVDAQIKMIEHEVALPVAELFNVTYALMLRLLAQFFANGGESDRQRDALRSATARLMSVAIRPVAEVLTTLPVSNRPEEGNAGPSFELYLPVTVPPELKNRWIMLFESFDAVSSELNRLATSAGTHPSVARLAPIGETLSIMKRSLLEIARGTS